MAKSKYDDRRKDEDYYGGTYRVALPDYLLPEEIKQDETIIEGVDYHVARKPIYCAKCNTVIPVAMIQSIIRCPFCHKEF